MNFISIPFVIFIVIFLAAWNMLPLRYRYVALTIGSWGFYGWNDASILGALALITVWTWLGGLVLERYNRTICGGQYYESGGIAAACCQ